MRREGHYRQRSPGSWELKIELRPDPAAGRRRYRTKTVRGTQRDAQRELRRLLDQTEQGFTQDAGKLTLERYLDEWLAGHRATVSPRTAEQYGDWIEQHIKPAIGDKLLGKISTIDLNAFYADRLASGRLDGTGGLAPQTVRHLDRLLHAALRDAVRARLIHFNPVDDAKHPKVERRPKRTLSAEEFTSLLDHAKGGRLYAPVLVILATGLRRGELLALRWRHVDLAAGVLAVVASIEETRGGLRIKDPKTPASRRQVALPDFAVQALKDHRQQQREEHLALGLGWAPEALVFGTATGEPWTPRTFTQAVTRLGKSVGIHFTPHLGRHDHFTRLLQTGVHPKIAQVRAGHSSIAVTMDVYSHATASLQTEAVERMQAAFENIREKSGGISVAKALSARKGDIVKP